MEFVRSVGGRSILGDPRSPTMQKTLNLKINTEKVLDRSLAILKENLNEWFEINVESPYMLL